MQRCNCTVRLAGDLGNTVRKANVTPAEIVILRHIHGGPETVVEIEPTGMDKTPHAQERERLVNTYGRPIVDQLFPGQFAPLPVSFKDIAEDVADIPDLPEPGSDDDTGGPMPPEEAEDEPEEAESAIKDVVEDDELTGDDQDLIDSINEQTNKVEVARIAKENEVDPHHLPDKLEPMKKALIKTLFPDYKK